MKIFILLVRLWRHFNVIRKLQFGLLLILMLCSALAEIFSIGSILPFIGVLISPSKIYDNSFLKPAINLMEINNPQELLNIVTLIFCVAVVVASAVRLSLLWASSKLSFIAGTEISNKIYRLTLYQPYEVHCSRNSSEVIDGIMNKVNTTVNIINMFLNFTGSLVILTSILIAMLAFKPIIALSIFGGLGVIYITIVQVTTSKLISNSHITAKESTKVIKSLQEGLGGIRDVLINGNQEVYCKIYRDADGPLRRVQASNAFIGSSPRYAIEAVGILLIAFVAYTIAEESNGITTALPILGALAMGAQRLLPLLQQAYAAWTYILSGQASLNETLNLLDQPLKYESIKNTQSKLTFKKEIKFSRVNFRYDPKTSWVLKNIEFKISKGSRIGFIGSTGCGKSTLMDILMGLLTPTNGKIEIDDILLTNNNTSSWQAHISHVPQSIYLADSTIAENIAFGIPIEHIDFKRVKYAAQQAQIADNIESWPDQYRTIVGERGIRLSGGQRQRIGIARALYKRADILIFDEATSALDSETELSVMESIEKLNNNLTIVLIAHRISTLKNCNQILEIEDGCIKRIATYQEILDKSRFKNEVQL
jgi:ABC-type multidrug transport system fused ATPase/permease subunit